MDVGDHLGEHRVGEDVPRKQGGRVEARSGRLDIPPPRTMASGSSTLIDAGEGAGEPVLVATQGRDGVGVAGRGGVHDVAARARRPETRVVALEAGAGEQGLDAAGLAAIAGRRGGALLVGHPGERVVAPLPGDLVGAVVDPPADHDSAADTGAEDDAEDGVVPLARAVDGLGQGEAVGVVGDSDRAVEARLEVGLEGVAVEPSGVGVLDQAGGAGDDAGDADPDGTGAAGLRLELGDQAGDGVEAGLVVRWSRDAGGSAGDDDFARRGRWLRILVPPRSMPIWIAVCRILEARPSATPWLAIAFGTSK